MSHRSSSRPPRLRLNKDVRDRCHHDVESAPLHDSVASALDGNGPAASDGARGPEANVGSASTSSHPHSGDWSDGARGGPDSPQLRAVGLQLAILADPAVVYIGVPASSGDTAPSPVHEATQTAGTTARPDPAHDRGSCDSQARAAGAMVLSEELG